jgi:pteridine reductase
MPDFHDSPVVLITGAARRIGACIAKHLHQSNFRVILHYHHSSSEADLLSEKLNRERNDSACTMSADLGDILSVQNLARNSIGYWGRLDGLINNASSFYPTPLSNANENQWQELIGSNLQGPFFLSQAVSGELTSRHGAIINIADIHARQPLRNHSIYCIAKAGNLMLTKTLAKELAPYVRVNGIAPGVILWPENNTSLDAQYIQDNILEKVPLNRMGNPDDIAKLACFLMTDAGYITGQTIAVDGGKHLNN